MQLRISTSDGMPIYLQIVNQVKHLIASRRLSPGDEIPAIRTLANDLLINPNTVARAYLELEREGLVFKRHGSGTFVSEGGSPLARKERLKLLTERIDALLSDAQHLGVSLEDLLKLTRERHISLEPQKNP
jgi:GntR family transcriptional regulator